MTKAEELVLVDAAITKIYSAGQAYGVDGRTLTRANLPELLKRKEKLEADIAVTAGTTTGRTYAKNGGRG